MHHLMVFLGCSVYYGTSCIQTSYVGQSVDDLSVDVIRAGVRRIKLSGGRLNKKDGLTRYGDSHVKDKTS